MSTELLKVWPTVYVFSLVGEVSFIFQLDYVRFQHRQGDGSEVGDRSCLISILSPWLHKIRIKYVTGEGAKIVEQAVHVLGKLDPDLASLAEVVDVLDGCRAG